MDRTAAALQAHAHALAVAFDVRLIEAAVLKPEEALGLGHIRVALVSTITDETTYAVALHELGHLASPTGMVRGVTTGDLTNLLMVEEEAAWQWARHYALEWTPVMERLAAWALSTYENTRPRPRIDPPAAPPAAPAPPTINWKNYR
jgi:hypothetical protein